MPPKTVTLNAAFFEEIKDDSHYLRTLIETGRKMCERRPLKQISTRCFASLLAKLRDYLAIYFSLEETYGYFDGPLAVAPWLSERAESLRGQHEKFLQEIVQLTQDATDVATDKHKLLKLQKLISRFQSFLRQFMDHETREYELIHQAWNVDIGTGD